MTSFSEDAVDRCQRMLKHKLESARNKTNCIKCFLLVEINSTHKDK